jgi:hypothetical protein
MGEQSQGESVFVGECTIRRYWIDIFRALKRNVALARSSGCDIGI